MDAGLLSNILVEVMYILYCRYDTLLYISINIFINRRQIFVSNLKRTYNKYFSIFFKSASADVATLIMTPR